MTDSQKKQSNREILNQIGSKLYKLVHEKKLEKLEDLNVAFAAIAQWKNFYKKFKKNNIHPNILAEFTEFDLLFTALEKECSIARELLEQQKEENEILKGFYQEQLFRFTYWNAQWLGESFLFAEPREVSVRTFSSDPSDPSESVLQYKQYKLYPIMEQPGVKCTAALPEVVEGDTLEIQLNFIGTIDFASTFADMEKGGPGQESLKIHEKQLLKQMNAMIQQVKKNYPDKKIHLKIAGHSLGGTLAKGFTHSMQRALAIQNQKPAEVIELISSKLGASAEQCKEQLESLGHQLEADSAHFKELDALSELSGITLYALGAPGVSLVTDNHASLMTYAFEPSFLRAYNHYHSKDIIRKFGDREFLSGTQIQPQIATHKTVQFDADVTPEEIRVQSGLPFPGITAKVMAAHNQLIYSLAATNRLIKQKVTNTCETDSSLEKFSFSKLRRKIYEIVFDILKALSKIKQLAASIRFLRSYKAQEFGEPSLEFSSTKGSPEEVHPEVEVIKQHLSEINEDSEAEEINSDPSTSPKLT